MRLESWSVIGVPKEEGLEDENIDVVGLYRGYDGLINGKGIALSGGDPHERTPSALHAHINRLVSDWRETVDDYLVPGVSRTMLLEILDEYFAQDDGLPTTGTPLSVAEIAQTVTVRVGDEEVPPDQVADYVEAWLDVLLNDLRLFVRENWNEIDWI